MIVLQELDQHVLKFSGWIVWEFLELFFNGFLQFYLQEVYHEECEDKVARDESEKAPFDHGFDKQPTNLVSNSFVWNDPTLGFPQGHEFEEVKVFDSGESIPPTASGTTAQLLLNILTYIVIPGLDKLFVEPEVPYKVQENCNHSA